MFYHDLNLLDPKLEGNDKTTLNIDQTSRRKHPEILVTFIFLYCRSVKERVYTGSLCYVTHKFGHFLVAIFSHGTPLTHQTAYSDMSQRLLHVGHQWQRKCHCSITCFSMIYMLNTDHVRNIVISSERNLLMRMLQTWQQFTNTL
jgi:hypothetical protein